MREKRWENEEDEIEHKMFSFPQWGIDGCCWERVAMNRSFLKLLKVIDRSIKINLLRVIFTNENKTLLRRLNFTALLCARLMKTTVYLDLEQSPQATKSQSHKMWGNSQFSER